VKKNFNVPLLDARGEPAKDEGKLLTVADVAISALTEPIPGDEGLSSTEKIGLLSLAIRIGESLKPGAADGGVRDFSKEELVTIKTRALKNCRVIPYGRLCEVVDSDEAKSDETPKGTAGEST